MSLHPCFRRRWLLQVCLGKAFPRKQAFVHISVFLWLRKQQPRFAQGQPKGYSLTKELVRTTEAFARMNVVWEGPVCWVQCANMWQDCSLSAVQRQPVRNRHDGLNLTCLDQCHGVGSPWHKLLRSLTRKNCGKVYSLQSKFDRWVYTLVLAEGDCCRFA